MEYTHKVLRETFTEELEKAKQWAKRNESESWLVFGADKLQVEIQDDYFLAKDASDRSQIFFTPADFKPEHLILMIECNKSLVTKELVLAVVTAYLNKAAEAKD